MIRDSNPMLDELMSQQIVKKLRNEKGWSQSDLSSLSGLSVKTIQRLERGLGAPSLDTAKALGSVFERPFSDFLPSSTASPDTESSAQQLNANAESRETIAAQESAAVPAGFPQFAERYWRHAVIIVLVVTLVGFQIKLYQDVETLSAAVADLASVNTSDSAFSPQGITSSSTTSLRLRRENGSFADYYGDQALEEAFHAIDDSGEDNGYVTLLELIMLRDTAKIVTAWEDTVRSNSDVSRTLVLENYLRCYSSTRSLSQPAPSTSERISIMQECIYEVLADAGWVVEPTMDQALINLARRMDDTGPFYKQFTLPITASTSDY